MESYQRKKTGSFLLFQKQRLVSKSSYEYDALGRITKVTSGSKKDVSYVYDDYISLIIVLVLISADYFATGTTGIHNLCDMIFCIVRHFRLCSVASNNFCHTVQRIMLVCRHLSVTVCQFYEVII